jgi:multiple sugar transport system substrate-binding protein
MKRSWKSVGVLLLTCALLTGLLAACGKSGNAGDNAPADPNSSNTGTAEQSVKKPEDYKGTVSVWFWDSSYFDKLTTEFNKVYPNIKIEFTNVNSEDYTQKVQTTLASGGELPDIVMADVGFRGKLLTYDIFDNLEQAPYNFDKSKVFDYTIPNVTSPKGEIVAVENAVNPAALAYRRDLAKEYFGTDDRKELEAMFPSTDALISKGQEVVQKSGGKVHLFAGLNDVYTILNGQNTTPIVKDGEVQATDRMKGTFETIAKIRDAGIADKLAMYSPEWNASMAAGKYIFYPAAIWSTAFVIKPNDTEGEGKWGLMMPPGGPFSYGGTCLGITKDSKNKELAWKFIEWALLTKEGAKVNKELIDVFIPLKEAYDDPQFASKTDSYFGGQDLGKFWLEEAVPQIKLPDLTPYDQVINESSNLILNLMNSDTSVTADQAIEKYVIEVKNKLPDVQVK